MKWISLIVAVASLTAHAELPLEVKLSGDAGIYTVTQWKHDWLGCEFEGGVKEGRVELGQTGGHRWLRVNFAKGKIGPEDGGAGWRYPIGKHETAELSYALRFSPDFEFVKGGKLPGLCGGPENVSGGRPADGKNGFSARLMWRRDGRGEAYVYHMNQKGNYGDSFAFPDDFRFPTNAEVKVRLRVTMNTPGKKDGQLKVWVTLEGAPERLLVDRTDLEWRSGDSFGVDGLYFEVFHGGGDPSWAPNKECWAEFGKMKVGP